MLLRTKKEDNIIKQELKVIELALNKYSIVGKPENIYGSLDSELSFGIRIFWEDKFTRKKVSRVITFFVYKDFDNQRLYLYEGEERVGVI
jgi:hypothetical protein